LLWTHKTQDENKQIKNGQSRDTGNIEHTKHRMKTNKSRMDNPEILATLGTQYTGRRQTNQEWAIQRYWKHWAHKTQDEDKQIKNGQSRDTGNIGHTKHRMKTNKSRMGNPEILATLGTQNTG
jgi:hypothetical protein